jgi:CHASE2 domain-containing sensor protein
MSPAATSPTSLQRTPGASAQAQTAAPLVDGTLLWTSALWVEALWAGAAACMESTPPTPPPALKQLLLFVWFLVCVFV